MRKMALALAFVGASAWAHEHSIGDITGKDIDLKIGDHAVAGAIKDAIVFGDMSREGSTLTLKVDGQLVVSAFVREGATFAGTIRSEVQGVARETRIEFVGIDQVERTITMKANGSPFTVTIAAEKYESNHFIDPVYSTKINGEKIEFAVKGSQACYGFSTHLIFMVVGAYIHGSH